ncbi:MAG: hypothetical protein V3U82_05015 [Robiginitomaculum sp.]
MEWFKGFVAILIAFIFIACFIGVLHYTSFERHHTHDWPSNQTQTQQSVDAYTSDSSLQHSDHKAQIVMAAAAVLGIFVASFGLFLIGKTLRATNKGTIAMHEALEEAKNASYRELRAYLGVTVTVEPLKKNKPACITIKILNFGQTPAYNVGFDWCFTDTSYQWNTQNSGPKVTLNPQESFTPILETHIVYEDILKREDWFLHLDIYFIDHRSEGRFVKYIFSTKRADMPTWEFNTALGEFTLVGEQGMKVAKMETADLKPRQFK